MPALATSELTKDYAVGFWRKRPYRALDTLSLHVAGDDPLLGEEGAQPVILLKRAALALRSALTTVFPQ